MHGSIVRNNSKTTNHKILLVTAQYQKDPQYMKKLCLDFCKDRNSNALGF